MTKEYNKKIYLKMSLLRIFSRSFILLLLILFSYVIMSYIEQINLIIPIINIPLISLISIMILAIIGIMIYRIFYDILLLLPKFSKILNIIFKKINSDFETTLKRIFYDIIILIFMIVILIILMPLFAKIPFIGIYLSTALSLLALAITILVFWDLGKIIYNKIEALAEYIAEKLE